MQPKIFKSHLALPDIKSRTAEPACAGPEGSRPRVGADSPSIAVKIMALRCLKPLGHVPFTFFADTSFLAAEKTVAAAQPVTAPGSPSARCVTGHQPQNSRASHLSYLMTPPKEQENWQRAKSPALKSSQGNPSE